MMKYTLCSCGSFVEEMILAFGHRISYIEPNTRAVPLVREDDVHQGRVFYLQRCHQDGVG